MITFSVLQRWSVLLSCKGTIDVTKWLVMLWVIRWGGIRNVVQLFKHFLRQTRRCIPLAIRLSAFLDSKDILPLVTAMSEKLTELGKFSQILLGGISSIQIRVDCVEYS